MRKFLIPWFAIAFGLMGCSAPPVVAPATPAQNVTASKVQADQAAVQAAITGACAEANGAAALASPFAAIPQVAGVITFVNGACGTGTAVSALVTKAVNDPNTVAWTINLADMLNADVAKMKSVKL